MILLSSALGSFYQLLGVLIIFLFVLAITYSQQSGSVIIRKQILQTKICRLWNQYVLEIISLLQL